MEPEDHLEGKGCMIGDRDRVAGEKGFVGCKDTHHLSQLPEQLGGGREGLPPERSSPYLQITLGRAGGFYSFLSILYRIKLSPV